MIEMLKRHEIQVLRRAGHSQIEVATLAGVSRRSVQRVDAEATVTQIDTARERAVRGIGRPATAEPFRSVIAEILAQEPERLSVEILRRAKLKGYAGGKTALYTLISALRPKTIRPLVRFEGLAGEFTQHDFGHVDVRFLKGTEKRVHFFASRLKYSRWVEVTIVPDECTETLVRTFVPGEGSTLPEHRAQHVAAVSGKRAKRDLQREHLLKLGPEALAYLTELTRRRPQVWLRDIDRLHTLLATYGDDAMRTALARGAAEHETGAEYIAHFLAETVTTPGPIPGDSPGQPDARSWPIGHPGRSSLGDGQLALDLPSANATTAPRAARVQATAGARRAGAKRRAGTRASTVRPFDADGGRS